MNLKLTILKRLANCEPWTIDSRGRSPLLTKFMQHVIPEYFNRESRLESGPPIKTFGGDKTHLPIGKITICEPAEYKCGKKPRIILLAVLGICLLAVYGYRLSFPPEMYFDEIYHVKSARDMAISHSYYATTHPHLWNVLAAFCILSFGDHAISWRVLSLICGVLSIFLVYAVTRKITHDFYTACLAAFLFSFDCISLTQSRIAMLNTMAMFFTLLSLLCFLKYFSDKTWSSRKAIFWTGVFWGLALATKLTAFSFGLFLAGVILKEILLSKNKRTPLLKETFLYLCLIPVIVYFSSYLFVPLLKDRSFSDIWELQKYNLSYHSHLREGHGYSSPWWSWPLMLRPIWYYFESKDEIIKGILCIGNPAIFWIIPVAWGYLIWDFLKRRSTGAGLILLGFLTQWLFYCGGSRVKFFHYFYSAMPFVVMMSAIFIKRVWQSGKIGQSIVIIYLLLVVGMSIYWYPLLTGFPISEKYYQHHIWFRSWI